ncbi:MAG TPA: glutamate--tRNA ligase, partial [Candidatus Marinimicrobia bacterium]|nr:glutamate--tRNA ligase [Candidatus Neomarinimicrobiota bacterium]
MNSKNPRVRFAPSPTGELHLGGARTALFNWLFARHHDGQFLLRIEDTDQVRSKEEFTQQICDSLSWLGLAWDEEPVFQSRRGDRYSEMISILLETEHSYRCFCSKEALAQKRDKAQSESGGYMYDGTCRALSEELISEKLSGNHPFVVRLKVPRKVLKFQDHIYGEIEVNTEEIDDFIVARSDGNPTYNLVVVIDDHDMDITHVIRGEDH